LMPAAPVVRCVGGHILMITRQRAQIGGQHARKVVTVPLGEHARATPRRACGWTRHRARTDVVTTLEPRATRLSRPKVKHMVGPTVEDLLEPDNEVQHLMRPITVCRRVLCRGLWRSCCRKPLPSAVLP
jgi:hypothetical protein